MMKKIANSYDIENLQKSGVVEIQSGLIHYMKEIVEGLIDTVRSKNTGLFTNKDSFLSQIVTISP